MLGRCERELLEQLKLEFIPYVAYAKGNYWSKWILENEWDDQENPPNNIQIAPHQIVLESDLEFPHLNLQIAEKISAKLSSQKIPHIIAYTGNKSYHVHFEALELLMLPPSKIPQRKKEIATELIGEELMQQVDHSNFNSKKLIAKINQPHRKTGVIKKIVKEVVF